jgi:hypothetical protein
MHYTSIYYQWTDELVGAEADATKDMRNGRLMGMLDDNLNNKIERAEVRGRITGVLMPRFDKLDVNKDDAIDGPELAAATDLMKMFGSRQERETP